MGRFLQTHPPPFEVLICESRDALTSGESIDDGVLIFMTAYLRIHELGGIAHCSCGMLHQPASALEDIHRRLMLFCVCLKEGTESCVGGGGGTGRGFFFFSFFLRFKAPPTRPFCRDITLQEELEPPPETSAVRRTALPAGSIFRRESHSRRAALKRDRDPLAHW